MDAPDGPTAETPEQIVPRLYDAPCHRAWWQAIEHYVLTHQNGSMPSPRRSSAGERGRGMPRAKFGDASVLEGAMHEAPWTECHGIRGVVNAMLLVPSPLGHAIVNGRAALSGV